MGCTRAEFGDRVAAEQSLLTVESDKASMEIPSSHAGVVKELKVALGDKVAEGTVIMVLDVADAAAASVPTSAPVLAPTLTPAPAVAAPPAKAAAVSAADADWIGNEPPTRMQKIPMPNLMAPSLARLNDRFMLRPCSFLKNGESWCGAIEAHSPAIS